MINRKEFFNLPKPLETSDYEECVELVRKDAVSNGTVRAVYLMGGEWRPGISDLDIVVVYKDSIAPKYLKSPWSLSKKAKFIFTHRYLSFDEKTARLFHFLYPQRLVNLRLICGTPIEFEAVSLEEKQWTEALVLFDVLVNKLLLFERYRRGPYNVRNLIGELYSLIYTIDVVFSATGEKIGGNFENEIRTLKNDWFNLDEEKALEALGVLIAEGIDVVFESVSALNRFVISKNLPADSGLIFSDDKFRISFSDHWSAELFKKEFKKSLMGTVPFFGKKVESYRLLLPSSLSSLFLSYAAGQGDFSNEIRNHLSKTGDTTITIKEATKHIKAMNEAYRSSKVTSGNFKIPFSFGLPLFKRGLKGKVFWGMVRIIRSIR